MCTSVMSSCSFFSTPYSDEPGYNINSEEFKDILETKSVQYMKDKYDVNCSMITYARGSDYTKPRGKQGYYAVSMKLEGVSGKPDGYETLKYTNEKPENEDHAFYVYIDCDYEVIGDQYMWYMIYPRISQIIDDIIEKYAPCNTTPMYANVCSDYLSSAPNGSFYFSAETEIPGSNDQMKNFLLETNGLIEFCILESGDSETENWREFVVNLKEHGMVYKYRIVTANEENFEIADKDHSINDVKYIDILSLKNTAY